MFLCKYCGGNIKFNIEHQTMLCEYCGHKENPYAYENEQEKDSEEYDVNVFSCPKCGGEILSKDDSISEFCSFCGSSAILHSRIKKEKRPMYIIPFKRTKESCKQEYLNRIKKAIYAPKALKDENCIDSFRGIYMPYWIFHITQQGPFEVEGRKYVRVGKHITEVTYELNGFLDCAYKGISYDANSLFDDDLSETITPFDVSQITTFTPAFLSGFYANRPDIIPHIYAKEARYKTVETTLKNLDVHFQGMNIATNINNYSCIPSHVKEVYSALYPIWFMSYKNDDQITYVAINGQTGKIAMNIPIDTKKFFIGSILTTIVIFILFLFLCMTPSLMLKGTIIGLLLLNGINILVLKSVEKQKKNSCDKGKLYKTNKEKLKKHIKEIDKIKYNKINRKKYINILQKIFLGLLISSPLLLPAICFMISKMFVIAYGFDPIWPIAILTDIILLPTIIKQKISIKEKLGISPIISSILIILCSCIGLLNPLSFIPYYIGAILLTITSIFVSKNIVKSFNIKSTRKMPEFNGKEK